MLDVAADQGWLGSSLKIAHLLQMVVQARWINDSPLSTLPHIEPTMVHQLGCELAYCIDWVFVKFFAR